eukprot:Platyproteum_vivax@DN5515_c0_g1_i3.p1
MTLKFFLVGGEEIYCTTELLSNVSDVFDAMLNHQFKESTQDVIELPEDDPDAFEKFIKLAKIAVSKKQSFDVHLIFGDSSYGLRLLNNTYLLASKYNATKILKLLQHVHLQLRPQINLQDLSVAYELNRLLKPVWSDRSIAQLVAEKTERKVDTMT